MLAGNNFTENFNAERLKQYPQLFLLANLSITIKGNQLQEKSAGGFIFEETKESKFLTHYSQQKKKTNSNNTLRWL